MIRGCLLVLMLAYAVVPPGFCFCRLSNIMLAQADDSAPDDDDQPGDCGCPRIQHDGVLPTHVQVCGDMVARLVVPHEPPAVTEPRPFQGEAFCLDPSLGAPPLYITLRAFLI